MFKVPFFFFKLYRTNYVLSNLLDELLDVGIEHIDWGDDYYLTLKFKNGIEASIWNRMESKAWCCRGTIWEYRWNQMMPTRKVLRKLYRAIYIDYKPMIKVCK